MSKKFFAAMTGAIALALGVGLNTQNALNDYGISENPLSKFVWAQTNTDGDETDDDDGNNTSGFIVCHYNCGITVTGDIYAAALRLGIKIGEVTAGGALVGINAGTDCEYGGKSLCVYRDCFMFNEQLLGK